MDAMTFERLVEIPREHGSADPASPCFAHLLVAAGHGLSPGSLRSMIRVDRPS
jgi:hypothetical protein